MDSGRSGNLDDSPGRSGGSSGGTNGSDAADVGGGSVLDHKDLCDITIETKLQDIEQCDFYRETHNVPPANTPVRIERREKRAVAVNNDGKTIGTLPARFDQDLAPCMESGFNYTGTVTHSSVSPILRVEVIVGLEQ